MIEWYLLLSSLDYLQFKIADVLTTATTTIF
jgi:hypothetical protein